MTIAIGTISAVPTRCVFLQNEGDSAMFTYAQCRAIAEQKLAQAEHDPRMSAPHCRGQRVAIAR